MRKKRRRSMSTPQSSSEVVEISISSDEEDFTEEPTWRRIHGVALSTKDKDCRTCLFKLQKVRACRFCTVMETTGSL